MGASARAIAEPARDGRSHERAAAAAAAVVGRRQPLRASAGVRAQSAMSSSWARGACAMAPCQSGKAAPSKKGRVQ